MAGWDPSQNASNLWYLAGIASGIGTLIAIIYVLVSESKKKVFSLLFLIGIIGPLIVWLVCRDDDHKLAYLSKKLLIGNLISIVIIVIVALLFLFINAATVYNGLPAG